MAHARSNTPKSGGCPLPDPNHGWAVATGKSAKICQVCQRKIFRFTFLEIRIINWPSHPQGGALAIVTKRWDGMGWDGMGCGGRGQRRRFFAPDEALSAYGEVVWSWRRDAGAKPAEQSAGDGDNKPAHRG